MKRAHIAPVLTTLFLVVLAWGVSSCARRGMPPGGPVDTEPPAVVSTSPDSGAVRVGTAEVCIRFSEPMDRRTVREVVFVRPRVELGESGWRKNEFYVSLGDSLDPSITYSVLVMSGCKDVHGNSLRAPRVFSFTAGESLMAGVIQGTVKVKTLPAPGVPVWVFDSLKTPRPDFTKDEPEYVAQSGPSGEYSFIGLSSGVYLVFAFKDKDGNRVYDQETDFTSPAEGAVTITPGHPEVTRVDIPLADPSEPAQILGIIHHCFPDTVLIMARARSLDDTLAVYGSAAGRDSLFGITDLPAGRYAVDCFADFDQDGLQAAGVEPGIEEVHVVRLLPGDSVKDVVLEIPCEEEGPE